MKTLRGVKYLRDAKGRRTAVVIDLRHDRALWEDFADVALARTRAGAPKYTVRFVRSARKELEALPNSAVLRIFPRIEALAATRARRDARSCAVPATSGVSASATIA